LSKALLNDAAQRATVAISFAERAFFDPTMVSMLYFPAEHILAIYMPFFIPIAVPMISTLVKEIKQLKNRRRKVKVE
jgi:phosphatidylinositol glycan class S